MTPEMQVQGKWWSAPPGTPVGYCEALGATLRRLREAACLTRDEVSSAAPCTSTKQLVRYETGEAKPPLRVIATLCEAYGENPIELLTRVAAAMRPDWPEAGPLTDRLRFFAVVLLYDDATPNRGAIDRKRAERRRQLITEDTTSP